VFGKEIGKPMDSGNILRRYFWSLLKKARLPRIRFPQLRRTAVTLLMGQGIHSKIVSEIPGHSKISITLDLYSQTLMWRGPSRPFYPYFRMGILS